jgi:hypothetical protein
MKSDLRHLKILLWWQAGIAYLSLITAILAFAGVFIG